MNQKSAYCWRRCSRFSKNKIAWRFSHKSRKRQFLSRSNVGKVLTLHSLIMTALLKGRYKMKRYTNPSLLAHGLCSFSLNVFHKRGPSMNRLWIVSLLLVLGLVYVGCDRGKEPGTKTESAGTQTESKMSDSDLEKAVRAKIESDPQLKQANINVDANADRKEVTLSGTVPSQDMRAKAVELAKGAQPGVTVNDKIDVKPAA
jgi:hypothetical protein